MAQEIQTDNTASDDEDVAASCTEALVVTIIIIPLYLGIFLTLTLAYMGIIALNMLSMLVSIAVEVFMQYGGLLLRNTGIAKRACATFCERFENWLSGELKDT